MNFYYAETRKAWATLALAAGADARWVAWFKGLIPFKADHLRPNSIFAKTTGLWRSKRTSHVCLTCNIETNYVFSPSRLSDVNYCKNRRVHHHYHDGFIGGAQIEWKTTETFFHPLIYTSLSLIVRQYSSASLYDGNWWQLKVSRAGAFSSSGIISHYRGYLAGKFCFDLKFTSPHLITDERADLRSKPRKNPPDPNIWKLILFCSLVLARKIFNLTFPLSEFQLKHKLRINFFILARTS